MLTKTDIKRTKSVRDAWPVWRQTYGYLSTLPWYQTNTAWWQKRIRWWTPCPRLHLKSRRTAVEPATYWSQVQHPTTRA